MHTSRRILILCATGTVIYLVLALYHGRQLDKIPSQPAVNGQGRSAKSQEKNWVQVSTADDRPGRTLRGQTEQRQQIPPAEAEDDREQSDSAGTADPGGEAAMAGEYPELRLADLQAELQENARLLAATESEARRLREALAAEQRAKRQAEETVRRLRAESSSPRQEQPGQLVDLDRLQAELQEARTRAAIAGEEQRQARLKAEAMFKYGQEQGRQLAPALQENEALRARLQEADSKLRQAEEKIIELTRLRDSGPAAVQTDDPESGATAAPAPAGSAGPGETRAGRQTD